MLGWVLGRRQTWVWQQPVLPPVVPLQQELLLTSRPQVLLSRRVPLSNNPNVANSPLRGASALAAYAKQKRSHATVQREEPYGQPPPIKKQALDNGSARVIRSPSKLPRSQAGPRGATAAATRPAVRDRQTSRPAAPSRPNQDADTEKEVWKRHHRAKFPKMVFYFESIPDDIRAKLIKRVTYLGAVRPSSVAPARVYA